MEGQPWDAMTGCGGVGEAQRGSNMAKLGRIDQDSGSTQNADDSDATKHLQPSTSNTTRDTRPQRQIRDSQQYTAYAVSKTTPNGRC